MSTFPALLSNELLKLKRTLALLMTLVMPLCVVVLGVMFMTMRGSKIVPADSMFYLNLNATWSLLVQPLFVAICGVLVHGVEHRSRGWQRVLVLPVTRTQVFFSKLFTMFILLLLGTLALLVLGTIAAQVLLSQGALQAEPQALNSFVQAQLRSVVAVSAVLCLQHWLSMRWSSFVPPLAVAVAGTMSILNVSQSEKYWKFDPWTYGLITANVRNPDAQDMALVYSLILSAVFLVGGVLDMRRKEFV